MKQFFDSSVLVPVFYEWCQNYAFWNFQWKSVEWFTGDKLEALRLRSHALASPIVFAALRIPLQALVNRFDFAFRIKQAKYFGIRPDIVTDGGRNLSQRTWLTVSLEKSICFIFEL